MIGGLILKLVIVKFLGNFFFVLNELVELVICIFI